MTSEPRNSLGWPAHVAVPDGLSIKTAEMTHPMMQQAFLHAMKHQALQVASGMRAVTSTLVAKNGTITMGVAGELCDTVPDASMDDITYHAQTGKCDRVQSDGNVDYNKCPGCRHDRHSEQCAVHKALRDGVNLTDSEIYLYGQWWVCEPCSGKAVHAGVKTIYLLPNARDLFDRSAPGQAERLRVFQDEWIHKTNQ
jgi:deoxycytidylate deaminase